MTTWMIEKSLSHMALQQKNFEVSIHNPIKLTDSLKVTAGYPPWNNSEKYAKFNTLK